MIKQLVSATLLGILSGCGASTVSENSLPTTVSYGEFSFDYDGKCNQRSTVFNENHLAFKANGVMGSQNSFDSFWTEELTEVPGEVAFAVRYEKKHGTVIVMVSTISKRHSAWPDEAKPVQEIYVYTLQDRNWDRQKISEMLRTKKPEFSSPLFECRASTMASIS